MEQMVFVAVSPDGKRHEWTLEDEDYQVGRADGQTRPYHLAVEGDPHLSRQHFSVRLHNGRMQVRRNPGARNPIFWNGQENDAFEIKVGQFFTTGKTQFGLRRQQAPGELTLFGFSKEKARLRRLQDCFDAVIQLLERLRKDPTSSTPWRPAFEVIHNLLPRVEQLLFVEILGSKQRVLDRQGEGEESIPGELVRQALEQYSTVTLVTQSHSPETDQTVAAIARWRVLSPLHGLESSSYALSASGSGYLEPEDLEEVAAIIDLVAELVGHHLVVQQASEYSNLLGVFGHHVGTLFKTSGALRLWNDRSQSPEVRGVIHHLLPIWGVSQAISLHKKQGEQGALPADWVLPGWNDPPAVLASLRSLVAYLHSSVQSEPPFLPWWLEGQPLALEESPLLSLPPLNDNPVVLDKTLALTIGLVEMLNNLRKYPEPRGAGREDRRELAELPEEERRVHFRCYLEGETAVVELEQPVVTTGDGSIPQSRSLDRIRALESRLLGALVETGRTEKVSVTSLEHILRVRQRWIYHWGRLCR
ncbi:MAG: hypothetical protein J0I12_14235 [Candidatus Eremiobacteraeota bacterium]|nr:hypothetical protein [Candidatus Eremiobacteraeota bacterium]